MAGLLSLKWNNHSLAFLNLINNLHAKELYCDATIACHGKYYPVHRIVLSTCSEYFQEIFKLTQCKHPFIIVNDIQPTELEALLNYMYKGNVNVLQEMLPSLIKAAEALKVKGLAVPDELPPEKESSSSRKRSNNLSNTSSLSKKSRISEKTNAPTTDINSHQVCNEINTEPPCSAGLPQDSSASITHDAGLSKGDIKEEPLVTEETPEMSTFSHSEVQFSCDEGMPVMIKSEPYDSSYSTRLEKEEKVESFQLSETVDWSDGLGENEANSQPLMHRIGRPPERSYLSDVPLLEPSNTTVLPFNESERQDVSAMPEGNATEPADGHQSMPFSPSISSVVKKCPHCSYYSKKMTNIKRHIYAKHTGERPFGCKVCPYRSVTKEALKVHVRKHTGEKPFACSFCPYRAASKNSVEYHIYSRHKHSL